MDEHTGSRTARVVAAGRAVGVDGRRDPVVAELLPAADRATVRIARALGAGRRGTVLAWSAHPAMRMLAVDAAVTAALRAVDAAALVVIGAGYDTRAWRLPAVAGRRVVELDHPATQAAKRRRLGRADDPLADAVELVPADLAAEDPAAVLDRAGLDRELPRVWLWESVVPYLPADAVDRTLAAIADRAAPGDRLVVTTVTDALFDPPGLGRVLGRPARLAMRALGEPVLLAESDAAVAARLSRHGWQVRSSIGPRRWAVDAGVSLLGPTLDERLHVAVREVPRGG